MCVFPLSRLSLLKDCPTVVKTGQKNTKYWKSHCSFCDLNALLKRNKTKSISHSTIQPWYQVHGAMCRAAWLDLSNWAECKDRITELAQTKGGCGFVLFYYNQKKNNNKWIVCLPINQNTPEMMTPLHPLILCITSKSLYFCLLPFSWLLGISPSFSLSLC